MNLSFTIPKHILDSFDIAGIQSRMVKADWYYEYSDDSQVWFRGNQEINEIKRELEELAKLEGGKETANQLWNAYVPEFSVSKPDILIAHTEFDLQYFDRQLQQYDWKSTFYDPLHDTIEADTDEAKQEVAEMELLLEEMQKHYRSGGREEILYLVDKYWKGNPMEDQINLLFNDKNETMNENNLAYLEKQLCNLGFGDHMNAAMKRNIENERSEFNLQHTFNYGGKDMLVDLSFRRGEQNEMYFFNSYRATMMDEPNRSHTFYLDKGNAITSKEAFNLLDGRAVNKDLVNKEGEKYNAWVQLDLKGDKDLKQNFKLDRYHENYGYDLTKAMNELILKPMSVEDDQKLYNSLSKGNVQAVTFFKDGEELKGFIEANPKDKTINIYDGHMKPLSKEQKQKFLDHEPGKEKAQKQEVKPSGGDDLEVNAELKKKRTRGKKNGVGI